METYLTIADLAAYIKRSEQTIRRYVLNRTVPYHKIQKAVRFRLSEIEKWIDGGGIDGTVTQETENDQGDLFAAVENNAGEVMRGSGKTESEVTTGEAQA